MGNSVAGQRAPDVAAHASAETRLSAHARAVLEILRAARQHPTAAELYEDARRAHPRLGQATVYRALAALEAAGLAVEVWRDALGRHYDARTEAHDHLICTRCGGVSDVERPAAALPAAFTGAAEQCGGQVASYEVRYYGVCAACRERGERTTPA